MIAEPSTRNRTTESESPASAERDSLIFGEEDLDALFPVTITLPDGRLVVVDALLAALADGNSEVPVGDGEFVEIDAIIDILSKEFGKVETVGDTLDGMQEGQASFREGPGFVILNALSETGRLGYSESAPAPPKTLRRAKDKDSDSNDNLRDVLIDGPPDADDDVIRPPIKLDGSHQATSFLEQLISKNGPGEFNANSATGSLFENDVPGTAGTPAVVSIEYNHVTYLPTGNQIIVEEPGAWRLTVYLIGNPGDPEYGKYLFEQHGPFDHTKLGDGTSAVFDMHYTVQDSNGLEDTAKVSFQIDDSTPDAADDTNFLHPDESVTGNVLVNDSYGADGPGGILEIGNAQISLFPANADENGQVTLYGVFGDLVFDFDNGSYQYTAKPDALGPDISFAIDEFHYRITDSDRDETFGTLTITVGEPGREPGGGVLEDPDPTDGNTRENGNIYTWGDVSEIDVDRDLHVDGADLIKGFDPSTDWLDIDGLLASLGYDDLASAGSIFRLTPSEVGIELQIDIGAGFETFVTVSNSPPLLVDDVANAIYA